MASKTTLNAQNLETLCTAQLAELLMEISEGNANAMQPCRFWSDGSRWSAPPIACRPDIRQIVEASLTSFEEPKHTAAALNFLEAESLARHIDDFGVYDTHEIWWKMLGNTYARPSAFWKALP